MSKTPMREGLDAETIGQYEAEYVFHPWIAQKGFKPFVAHRAKGNYIYDHEGKKYLDFTSQYVFNNLGHCDERVVAAIARQAATLDSVNLNPASVSVGSLFREPRK